MATEAQLLTYLVSESGQVPALQTAFVAMESAPTLQAKCAQGDAITHILWTAAGNFPVSAPTAAASRQELLDKFGEVIAVDGEPVYERSKLGAINWAGLLAMIEGLLPIILPLLKPTPAAA